jgi:hypothetical protein
VTPGSVVIVSQSNDFHALVVQHELNAVFNTSCLLVEYDTLGQGGVHWRLDGSSIVLDRAGSSVDLSASDVCWWRRIGPTQLNHRRDPSEVAGPSAEAAIQRLLVPSVLASAATG